MSRELEVQAERIKLARVLGVEAEALAALGDVPTATLRTIRRQTSAMFYADGQRLFENLAKASRLLPTAALASMASRVFGPMFSARITGFLPVDRAAAVASKLPAPFLAELSDHLDPRRVEPLLRQLPPELIVQVAHELHGREAWITMAMFVDCIPLSVIARVVEAIDDPEAMLQIGFFVEDPAQLDEVIAHFDAERLDQVVRISTGDDEALRLAGLSLFERLSDSALERLAPHLAALDDSSITRFVLLASDLGALHVLVRALPLMPRRRLEMLTRHFQDHGVDLQRLLLGPGEGA